MPVELTCKPNGRDANNKPCDPLCPYGVTVPDRDINQAETETYWIKDRAGLRKCRNAQNATVNYYEALRNSLNSPEN